MHQVPRDARIDRELPFFTALDNVRLAGGIDVIPATSALTLTRGDEPREGAIPMRKDLATGEPETWFVLDAGGSGGSRDPSTRAPRGSPFEPR